MIEIFEGDIKTHNTYDIEREINRIITSNDITDEQIVNVQLEFKSNSYMVDWGYGDKQSCTDNTTLIHIICKGR